VLRRGKVFIFKIQGKTLEVSESPPLFGRERKGSWEEKTITGRKEEWLETERE